MEARVLAAVLAFAVLVGVGIGWQMPRREVPQVTLERTLTVTVTSTSVVTWTVYEGGVRTTVTVTRSLGPVLRLLMPSGTCNASTLLVTVSVANAGDEPATVDFGGASYGVEGVREVHRIVFGPSYLQNQVTLRPGEDATFTIRFEVADRDAVAKYVRRSPLGAPILSLNLTIPYSWSNGASELRLGSVFIGVVGDCQLAPVG
ncbi:MAG: hypothetical protein QXW56_02610 [Nitrososphaerota archaeon]